MSIITRRERFRGALVGVLAGDALGAPYETMKSDEIKRDLEIRGGLTLFDYENPWKHESQLIFPKGRPTDDSDQTAALAESLIACRGLDERDVFSRLRSVTIDQKSPLWNGVACGAGRTTRTMLSPTTYEESQMLSSEGAFPSNGSLMRASPMSLFFAATFSAGGVDNRLVRRMSEITHRHPLAGDCCVAYAWILTMLLTVRRPNLDIAIATARFELDDNQVLAKLLDDPTVKPNDPSVWPGRGAAFLTLHVALWALLTTSSFREGIIKVVSFGGDTDTYAAVAGALLGAYYGVNSIPDEWKDSLIGCDVMEDLADKLLALGEP